MPLLIVDTHTKAVFHCAFLYITIIRIDHAVEMLKNNRRTVYMSQKSFKFRKLLLYKATFFFSLWFFSPAYTVMNCSQQNQIDSPSSSFTVWMFIASKTQTAFTRSPKPALETKERCVLCELQHPHWQAGLPLVLYRAVCSLKHLLYSELQQMRMLWESALLSDSIL